MPLKSTQTDKNEIAMMVMEGADFEIGRRDGFVVKKSVCGHPFVEYDSPMLSFNKTNRNRHRYDKDQFRSVVENDERLLDLKRRHIWRGRWNHPAAMYDGQTLSKMVMTIPEPMESSHMLSNDRFEGDYYVAHIITLPETPPGKAFTSELVDLGAITGYSVRLMGVAKPGAGMNEPNIMVSKLITVDAVDYPSDRDAIPNINPVVEGADITLESLAQYCTENDALMKVVCESFEISQSDIFNIVPSQKGVVIETATSYGPYKTRRDFYCPIDQSEIIKEAHNFFRR